MTPIASGELLGLLDEHVPERLRVLAEAAVTAEDEGHEIDRQALALLLVALGLGVRTVLDRSCEASRVRLHADERNITPDITPALTKTVQNDIKSLIRGELAL